MKNGLLSLFLFGNIVFGCSKYEQKGIKQNIKTLHKMGIKLIIFEKEYTQGNQDCNKIFFDTLKHYGIKTSTTNEKRAIKDDNFAAENILVYPFLETDNILKQGMFAVKAPIIYANAYHQWINYIKSPNGKAVPNVNECTTEDNKQLQINANELIDKRGIKIILFNWYYFDYNCVSELFKILMNQNVKIVVGVIRDTVFPGIDFDDIKETLKIHDHSKGNAIFGDNNKFIEYWEGKLKYKKVVNKADHKKVDNMAYHMDWLLSKLQSIGKPNNALVISNTVDCNIAKSKGMQCVDMETNEKRTLFKYNEPNDETYENTASESKSYHESIFVAIISVLLLLFFI